MILAHGNVYELWLNHKNGWNQEAFRDRYNEVLDRYDYIVGDWGHNQLRLKGFFKANHSKATKETSIVSLQDYLYEYCNFGCAYFVLEKVKQHSNQPVEVAEADEVEDEAHPDQYQGDGQLDDEDDDEDEAIIKGSNPQSEKGQNGSNHRSRRRRNRNRHRNKNRNPQNQAE